MDVEKLFSSFETLKRISTFAKYPNECILPCTFADAGFIYSGQEAKSDEVCCVVCKIKIWNWVEGDNPMEKHQKEKCEYVELWRKKKKVI